MFVFLFDWNCHLSVKQTDQHFFKGGSVNKLLDNTNINI